MLSKRMYIVFAEDEFASLRKVARSECRHPREQVRAIIRQELTRRGLLAREAKTSELDNPADPTPSSVDLSFNSLSTA